MSMTRSVTQDARTYPAPYPVSAEVMDDVENRFTFHPAVGDQAERYEAIRRAGADFACAILVMCPSSAERTLAIREVEMAVMRANQSIAVNEVVPSGK